VLTLDEALGAGAIIRGIDINEDEVQLGEEMAEPVRERILRSGDEQLVRILRVLPEESLLVSKGSYRIRNRECAAAFDGQE
jgi:hypothetical protein